ncbi:MAG: serine/threonine protein phosphatase, partial [Lachnospiraceae bacterium]|nr:serine/threonine protein phosphatase [Lachnospiraceae bacterium]
MKNKVINIWDKYHHFLWSVIYMIVYLLWFALIETRKFSRYTVIHTALDDKIPFIEIFVIPYIIWFFYVAWIVLYTGFTDRYDYYRVCAFLFTGMTIFLLISTLWPNIHYLRPRIMPRDNIFCDMVSMIYRMDTSTNLWPSIHVYNSIGVYFAVMHSE